MVAWLEKNNDTDWANYYLKDRSDLLNKFQENQSILQNI